MDSTQKKQIIRLCFVSPKSYPLFSPATDAVFGGAEVDLYLLGTELAKDPAFDITFVTADYGQPDQQKIDNIRLIKSLNFAQNPLAGAARVWRALKKADADIYMIKTASPGVPLLARFCKKHNRRFIYRTAHQDECDGTYLKKHPLLGRLFNSALKKADMVFAQNSTDAQNLKKTVGADSVVIGNGHRLDPLPADRLRDCVLWIGRSADFKQPDLFIDLARQSANIKFVMICQKATGDTAYEALRKRAESLENIEFHQRVPFEKIEKYFSRAKLLINTSNSEGFANTFIQAGKWAVPILTLKVNPDNFLTSYSCGLCAEGDRRKLAEGLQFLLTNDKYIEIGLNARRYVEENHDVARIADLYRKIFTSLVTSGK